ncbi:hypothetical protein DPM19_24855 [Actinomadura craniellae]|uniref:CBM2 domain-containing protein n=1 Tax=Actinomadura craniellae TaxID=2231787 RepID=A0A365GZW6_9ACTN|nr:cellulose binding domain-containing protein [Actinomadura craniellae]RAY12384.1 hypothetical protein DPM19_24855 [Actinomadura craniellae]
MNGQPEEPGRTPPDHKTTTEFTLPGQSGTADPAGPESTVTDPPSPGVAEDTVTDVPVELGAPPGEGEWAGRTAEADTAPRPAPEPELPSPTYMLKDPPAPAVPQEMPMPPVADALPQRDRATRYGPETPAPGPGEPPADGALPPIQYGLSGLPAPGPGEPTAPAAEPAPEGPWTAQFGSAETPPPAPEGQWRSEPGPVGPPAPAQETPWTAQFGSEGAPPPAPQEQWRSEARSEGVPPAPPEGPWTSQFGSESGTEPRPMPGLPPAQQPAGTPLPPPPPGRQRSGGRRVLALVAGAAALIVLAGVAAVLLWPNSGKEPATGLPGGVVSVTPTPEPSGPGGEPAPSPGAPAPVPSGPGSGPAPVPSGAPPVPSDAPTAPIGPVLPGQGLEYRLVQQDPGYYEVLLTVTNDGTRPLRAWELTFTAPGDNVKNIWGGELVRRGEHAIIRSLKDAPPIPPGAAWEIRYGAEGHPQVPQKCLFNKKPCGF